MFIITLGLRLYKIEQKNMWFDEVYSWDLSQKPVKEIFIGAAGDIHPPLFYIVLKVWTGLLGDSVFSMRMLSVLFSLLGGLLIYKICRLIWDTEKEVLIILLLYAVSPLNIYYSQEVRMLNMNLFLCLCSVYYFMKYVREQNVKSGLPYLLLTFLAMYTHYFSFLIIAGQIFYVAYAYLKDKKHKNLLKKYPVYIVSLTILYIPWIPVMITQVSRGQPWRTQQTPALIGMNVFEYFKEIFWSYYIYYESNLWTYISLVSVSLIILLLAYTGYKLYSEKNKSLNLLITAIVFYIPLATGILVMAKNGILLSRYLSILVPYLLIILTGLSFKYFKEKTAYVICILLVTVSVSGTKINFENNFKNNDYRKIISYIEDNYKDNEIVISEPHYMGWAIKYYKGHNETKLPYPTNLGWNFKEITDSLQIKKNIGNFWIITDYSSMDTVQYKDLPQLMKKLHYSSDSDKNFYIIPNKVKVQHYVINTAE